jgi:hypothetical protein
MKTSRILKSLCLGVTLLMSLNALAFTATANVPKNVATTWWRASNFATQKEADKVALEGCRSEARKNGLAELAKQCAISSRAKRAGYGAFTCGDEGCGWTTGAPDSQAAVDEAYDACRGVSKNCQSTNIRFWEDFAGFKQVAAKAAPRAVDSCIPTTQVRRCTSQCVNGNCAVTYSNGCKVRVQVSPNFNPFNNQWEYPAPSC